MKTVKSFMMMAALMVMPQLAYAQSDATFGNNDFRSHGFVQVQGGLHLPLSSGSMSDLIKPNFGANVGAWFSPVVGARLGFEGLKSSVVVAEKSYSFDYYTIGLDAMFNLSALISKNNNPRLNAILLGGVGLTHYGDKDFNTVASDAWVAHHLRVGAALEYRIAKPLSVSLEYRLNNTSDDFNGVLNNKDDWYSSLLLGIAYNFGHTKKTYAEIHAPIAPKPLTLFEQKEKELNERMNVWMKRLKGESKDDFLARTSGDAMKTQRLEYSKDIATRLADGRANSTAKDLWYNSNEQLLGIEFEDMPSITLAVPGEDIKGIKSTGDLQFANTVYELNPGDKFEVIYTDVINPATGKKYSFVSKREANFVQTEGYQTIANVQEEIMKSERLAQAAATNAAAPAKEVKSKDVAVGNTVITVQTERIPKQDGKADYKVIYNYNVKDGFSVSDDFAPGKYEAEKSKASAALLKVINESLAGEFAPYVKPGCIVTINYQGSADASPINSTIAYNGKYGDIKDQPVNINGKTQNLSVTRASGISTNEQLSLVRAISVKNYILKNAKALKGMKVEDSFNVKVAPTEGSQFRRVSVEFLFPDAF